MDSINTVCRQHLYHRYCQSGLQFRELEGERKQNLTAEHNHWKPNTFAYPDNMTMLAVVELDDVEITSDSYELAAFTANGECRGSIKITYAEPLRRHIAFLTISGKDAAELRLQALRHGDGC